jgi:hypothetical protein
LESVKKNSEGVKGFEAEKRKKRALGRNNRKNIIRTIEKIAIQTDKI